MKEYVATRDMVAQCSDVVLRLDDGTDVDCVKYALLTTCDVLRFLTEDVTLPRDARGREVVPLPGIDVDAVRLSADLLHNVQNAADLGKAEVVAALRGMDLLGCRVHTPELHARLWHWLSEENDLATLLDHAPRLLMDAKHQTRMMNRLVKLRLLWEDFVRDVLDALPLSHGLITVFLSHLTRFYPASGVLAALLERLPHPTADKVIALCSRHGCYYHPSEVENVLETLNKTMAKHALDSPVLPLARSLLHAMNTFHPLPLTASRAHGSVVLFEAPMVSVLMLVNSESRKPLIVRVNNWLRVNIDLESGTMDASFVLSRFADNGTSSVQLRITCTPADGPQTEVWYTFEVAARSAWTSLSESILCYGHTSRQKVALQSVSQMRMDFFFDTQHSALSNPLL